ncbi:MAG: chemotaxis response regulator protein-glutamate methylesterase [Alphaproteobacteria bacterium]|nr:chemotaxis response regulator protein-glutamate methylesterase [Alphaproteobacteria bacterium]
MENEPKKVVIVDDSALMRQMLTTVLDSSPHLHVVGAAPNPNVARSMIKQENPDVVTLDIEMPGMDGLSFLEKIMRLRPMPVVMISSLTQDGAQATVAALEIGAVDFVGKPSGNLKDGIFERADEIISKVLAAAEISPSKLARLTAPKKWASVNFDTTEQIVAIGASTGGVTAIGQILSELPANAPAILITQHMPNQFTGSFAERLNKQVAMTVTEAGHKERVLPGHVYIAPGDRHLRLGRSGANYVCLLDDGPLVSGHRPSVDVLFESVAENAGARAIGVILTGMGKDGAQGLLKMQQAGAYTLGQDEASAVVYGMCKVAHDIGGVLKQVPLDDMASAILSQSRKQAAALAGGARRV